MQASPRRWARLFNYLVAAGFVAAATLVRSLLDPWLGDSLPYITYFAAIVTAAWFGRLGPSLFAVALSCIAADWFFIPPRYSLKPSYAHPSDWVGLVTFLVVFPLKGRPSGESGLAALIAGVLVLNGAWGLGVALIMSMLRRWAVAP